MRTALPFCIMAAVLLSACAGQQAPDAPPADREGPALAGGHNAHNVLDWAGAYEGTLPCADCPGIRTRLVLDSQDKYELHTQYLDRQPRPDVVRGTFTWQSDGSSIQLDQAGDGQRYFVAEGRLIALNRDGSHPQGPLAPHYILTRVP